jgi:polyferredoxin
MRTSVVLAMAGVALVVIGVAYADRSWGWTYPLAVLGAVMVSGPALRSARRSRLSAQAPK